MPKTSQHKKWPKVVIGIAVTLILILGVCAVIYLAMLNHNTDAYALEDTELTKVSSNDNRILLDGPGDKQVFVFYPGALCDSEAYCSLLKPIADGGTDVIIAKPLLHFQLLNVGQIDTFMHEFQYDSWNIGGHSLGGVSGAMYCAAHPDTINKIVFIAAYASEDISNSCDKALLLTASNDTVLNWDSYYGAINNCPSVRIEKCIEGGNHSQFGNYGHQNGDGVATISSEDQQHTAAKIINEFLDMQ